MCLMRRNIETLRHAQQRRQNIDVGGLLWPYVPFPALGYLVGPFCRGLHLKDKDSWNIVNFLRLSTATSYPLPGGGREHFAIADG